MALTSGTKLGPYEIVSQLGAGGMGEVYRARDTRLDRIVAIKVLPETLANDADRLQRFEQEARALSTLSHPNLLAIYDVGTQSGLHYLVSEFLEGQTLRDRMAAGSIPQRKASEYALQIANGLAAAHDKGIVHRDLKPENIFITRDEHVKILDFGLAKQQSQSIPGLTRRNCDPSRTVGHRPRHGPGNGRLHVPRTGARATARQPLRYFQFRLDSLRNDRRKKGIQRRLRRRGSQRHSQRGAS